MIDMASISAAAKAQADTWARNADLARSKENTPDSVEARKRVAKQFSDIHLQSDSPADRAASLARIDYAMPVTNVNARNIDINKPKKNGIFGFGRAPAYLISKHLPPTKPDDPIYALEYYPVKS